MSTHKVNNPFFCKPGQFTAKGFPGQVLVIGIAQKALINKDVYRFTIGKNSTVYEAPKSEILRVCHSWRNRSGDLVLITPVDLFTKKEQ